jgi:hypothetical protein
MTKQTTHQNTNQNTNQNTHQSRKKKIILILLSLLALAFITFLVLKPTQQQITEDVLQEKKLETDDYLTFIANNLLSGGPGKDDIPAIDNPKYVNANQTSLKDTDQVFGINYNGLTAAYPQDILYWHEIVNEVTNNEKISLTYCPLTGSIIGYKNKNLGVSGELYNSNLVFYDRETDSIYPQILGTAVQGKSRGEKLTTFPIEVTTWKAWKTKHPTTKVLTRNTGYSRDYDKTPYPGYEDSLRVWFPVAAKSNQFPSKKIIYGIEVNKEYAAIIKENIKDQKTIQLGGKTITITKDKVTNTLQAKDQNNQPVKAFDVFWFAWYAYHPDTRVVE